MQPNEDDYLLYRELVMRNCYIAHFGIVLYQNMGASREEVQAFFDSVKQPVIPKMRDFWQWNLDLIHLPN